MSGEPKCIKCGKPPTTRITEIVDGKPTEVYLCDEHAQTYSPYLKKPAQGNILEVLQHLLKQQGAVPGGSGRGGAGPSCPNCRLTYGSYRKTLLLGCSDCYGAFEDLLIDDLRKFHGAVRQTPEELPPVEVQEGVLPAPKPKTQQKATQIGVSSVKNLRRQMQKAILEEDFEKAARLRDMIRLLEGPGPGEAAAKPKR